MDGEKEERREGSTLREFRAHGANTIFRDNRTRPGARVARRRRATSKIGASHRINQAETIKWFKNRFEGIVRGGG